MSLTDARIALACLDLAADDEDATPATAAALARRAHTARGTPAALLVYPELLLAARMSLMREGIAQVRTAVWINRPEGGGRLRAESQARRALAAGADEIELWFPHRLFLAGEEELTRELIAAVKARCAGRTLKLMLGAPVAQDDDLLRGAARCAIAGGADFLHASDAATVVRLPLLLEAIAAAGRPVGLKLSGVETLAAASAAIAQASTLFGRQRVVPARLRLQGAGLLDAVLTQLATEPADED